MRIVCEQCQTKYVVPDEKIVKNVLRLTCQKCGHVITTRVEESQETPQETSSGTLGKWRSTTLNTPRRLQADPPSWYYSYNGESFGPYTEAELKERLLSDKLAPIAEQCFVWNKSFSGWKPVLEVEPFASTILMPPPPPPAPAPAPQNDENLPPLFSGSRLPSSTQSPAASSPDLLGLKQRLQKPSSALGAMPNRQRESLAKLASASSLFGKVEQNADKQGEIPTHTQIPAVDALNSCEEEIEESGETTRVAAASPLLSFQSLDAISPEIKAESKSGAAPVMTKPFPAIAPSSGIPAFGQKSSFGNTSAPNISSLFGNKPADNSKPRFSGLRSIASSPSTTFPAASGIKPAPAADPKIAVSNPATPKTAEGNCLPTDLPDFKEDIGAIVNEPAAATNSNRSDSISNWLPSQSSLQLDSKLDAFSDSELSLAKDVIDNESAKDSLPSFDLSAGELPEIDLNEASALSPAAASATSDVLPDIDLNEASSLGFSSPASASSDVLPDIDLNEASALGFSSPASASSDVLPDIDMDEDSQLIGPEKVEMAAAPMDINLDEDEPAEEQKLVSAAQMLSIVRKSTVTNTVPTEQNPAISAELESIDLDKNTSQAVPEEIVDSLTASHENQPKRSGIVDFDALFDDKPEDSSVAKARVSHNTLDEIAAKHADLFAEAEKLEEAQADESSVSESSMLIQLNHFQKIQEKEKRNNSAKFIAAIVILVLIIGLGSGIGWYVKSTDDEKTESQTGFAKVTGNTVTSDDLQVIVPEDDFEIVDANAGKAKSRSSKSDSAAKNNQNTGSAAPDNAANGSDISNADAGTQPQDNAAANAVADALYGNDAQKSPENAQPTTKNDGRANVVLQKNDAFAGTNSVQGSKYAVKNNSRDLFAAGLKNVSSSVQTCARRVSNKGEKMPAKVYIYFTIQPQGKVSEYRIQEQEIPEMFSNCLNSKLDSWKFNPFDGDAVTIKQAFILGD